eukprot:SAG31_NODE_2731_length_5175_cov_1.794129_5_plen_295_part_00
MDPPSLPPSVDGLVSTPQEKLERNRKRQSKWALLLGLFLQFAVGPMTNLCAFAFAPASILAPLASMQLLVNIAVAPHTLGEQRLPGHIVSAMTIASGIVGVTISGHQEEPDYTLQMLEDLFLRPVVAAYFGVFTAWQVVHWLLVVRRRPKGDLLRGLSLGMMAGAFNGNMFFVKILIELIKATSNQGFSSVWSTSTFPYIVIVGMTFFVVMIAYMVTKAHKEYDAMFMVSVYVGTTVLFGTVSAVIVLDEFKNLPRWRVAMFWLSWVVVVVGIYILFRTELGKRKRMLSAVAPE